LILHRKGSLKNRLNLFRLREVFFMLPDNLVAGIVRPWNLALKATCLLLLGIVRLLQKMFQVVLENNDVVAVGGKRRIFKILESAPIKALASL
jgi:hypothetical protein